MTIEEGNHTFKIVVENRQGGTCYSETSGEFKVDEDECVKIYYNVVYDLIRYFSKQY